VGVVLTVLGALTYIGKARITLDKLAKLEAPETADDALKRRVSWLRCAAAQILAERNFDMPLLRACDLAVAEDKRAVDPIPSSIAARAVVAAIGVDGVKLTGKRLTAWRAYATGGDVRAREAAIELLGDHAEVIDAAEVLAGALGAEQPGVVAAAATVLSKHPQRAQVKVKKETVVHEAVAKALRKALEGKGPSADIETLTEVISAVGALGLPGSDKALVRLCSSPNEALRERAIKSLAMLLGDVKKVRCDAPGPQALPVERDHLMGAKLKLALKTDAGDMGLELDPTFAPVAVTRVADLVKAGYYDGLLVHRVVPGFVSQFGSPTADGYGGAEGKAALPCETTPLGFGPLTVGVALAGRDTGSSQLFVTHAAYPHLDGKYAILGSASGAWDALVEGDRIIKATIDE
jgi:cyclophilin family peptidyl-prolyl cis-trans isomerase